MDGVESGLWEGRLDIASVLVGASGVVTICVTGNAAGFGSRTFHGAVTPR
jgi:hypothetical protein